MSDICVLFQRLLASHLIRTLVQRFSHVALPVCSPVTLWYLNLVLSVLKKALFEPIRDTPLSTFTPNVVILVAIKSTRRVSELTALF